MNDEEKKKIELDIEAKYVGKTEKEFLSRLTYAECLYILTPENKYRDEVIKLSVLKIREIIDKLQKQIEKLKEKLYEILDKQKINELSKKYKAKINVRYLYGRYFLEINNHTVVDTHCIIDCHEYIQSREFERDIKAFLYKSNKGE